MASTGRLLAEIAAAGPLPFERFMAVALYGEGGFFTADVLRSARAGDFLTSPEVSPAFGEALAVLVRSERERVGEPFALVEVGAGSGSLLVPLLAAEPCPAWAVEASPAARRALAGIVGEDRVAGSLDDIPGPLRGVVLANELLDNLPMAMAQLTPHGWRERWVGADGDRLCLVDAPVRPGVRDWLDRFAGDVEPGGWVEVQLAAGRWLGGALARLEAGAIVVIDYGDTAENLVPRRADGTLRTYRSHHLGPHPLDEPGEVDITADVNFTALEAVAREAGASVELRRQDDVLASLGLRERISGLRRDELAAARAGDEVERLRLRSVRSDMEALLHPRGLGDFKVLVARR